MSGGPEGPGRTSRREFLRGALRSGGAILATSALGYALHDPLGPGRPGGASREGERVTLPDFAVPGIAPRMAIATGPDRSKTLNRALEALGGLGSFIRPGDRVVIKVNAAFASPPALSATTDPGLLAEVARLCVQAGAATVAVTDNPINDPEACFALTGIAGAARSAGARVHLPRASDFRPTTVPGGKLIRDWPLLYGPLEGATRIIGIAPVKDHHRAGASMSLKNWYGLLGGRRSILHQDIHRAIGELALMVRPTLVILDGTLTMMTNGPTGGSIADLKRTDTLIVSTDPVAADAFGATLLGRTAADLPYIGMAAAAGAGTADYRSLNPVRIGAG